VIDIDLLFYKNKIIEEKNLVVPHPRIFERRFILEPLCEVIPDEIHPVYHKTLRELLNDCKDTSLVKTHHPVTTPMSAISEKSFKDWIRSFGDDPDREGLEDTYQRFMKSRQEIFSGYSVDPKSVITLFDSEGYDEMIISRDIDFFSTCEHHLLPFYGRAHIGYIPDERIIGLSKFARIIDVYSRRLQNQERLTTQIADFVWETVAPKGLGFIIEAEHLCIKSRGADKQNSIMTTSAFRGNFKSRPETRSEFLDLISKPRS